MQTATRCLGLRTQAASAAELDMLCKELAAAGRGNHGNWPCCRAPAVVVVVAAGVVVVVVAAVVVVVMVVVVVVVVVVVLVVVVAAVVVVVDILVDFMSIVGVVGTGLE